MKDLLILVRCVFLLVVFLGEDRVAVFWMCNWETKQTHAVLVETVETVITTSFLDLSNCFGISCSSVPLGYLMSTSCHFADLEYCTTKDAKGKAIAVQITTRNTVCCSSIGLQVFSCSTRFSVQQNVARLVLLSTAYRWVMTRCDTNSAQGGVCGFFRTCTAAKPTNLIAKRRSLCRFRMFEPNFGHTQKLTNKLSIKQYSPLVLQMSHDMSSLYSLWI